MSDTMLHLSDCFPNPESCYYFRGGTGARLRGDDASVAERLRGISDRGEVAWRAGLDAWTGEPASLLGTWVRDTDQRMRWCSKTEVELLASAGPVRVYARGRGWFVLARTGSSGDSSAMSGAALHEDFLVWRARHANTARVAWKAPSGSRAPYDVSPADMTRFCELASGLTVGDPETGTAAVSALCGVIAVYGNNSTHAARRARLAEAGVVESAAYLIEIGRLHSRNDADNIRSILDYIIYCDAPNFSSHPRERIFSDLIMELFLDRVRGGHPDASLILKWLPELVGVASRVPDKPGVVQSMTPRARSEWAEVLHSTVSSSPIHLELSFRLLWVGYGNSPQPELYSALLQAAPTATEATRRLVEHYLELDQQIRMTDGSRCLAHGPDNEHWSSADHRVNAARGLVRACKSSNALGASLLPLSSRLEAMLTTWERSLDRFNDIEDRMEARARRSGNLSYQRRDWPGVGMYRVFQELLAIVRAPPS